MRRTADQLIALRAGSATLDAWAAHQHDAHAHDEHAACDRCAELLEQIEAFRAAAARTRLNT